MVKKNKSEDVVSERRETKGKNSWNFLSISFENIDLQVMKRHILLLVVISLLTGPFRHAIAISFLC